MANRDLTVRIDGDSSGFDAATRKAAASARQLAAETRKLEQQQQRQHQAMDEFGRAGMLAGAAIATGIGFAVKKFADFDQAMSKVEAATQASASSMLALRDAAMDAGARTSFSATEAAAGIEALGKAGVSTRDILNGGLNGALDLAAAGSLGVGEAAEIAATALTQFGLSGGQIPHVADLLAAAAGKAQGEVSDMGQALKQSGLVAAQTGLTIEETTTALASFASAGLLGSDAGTSLKTMLQRLTPTSKEAAGAMDAMGFSAYDSQGNFIGLQSLAAEMQDSFRGMTAEQRNATMATIFGSDAVRAASVLYEQGATGIAQWTEKVDDAGFAQETAATKLDNLKGDFEALGGAIETALIGAGSGANDVLREMTQSATNAVNAFNGLPEPVQQGATGIAALTAAGLAAGGAFFYAVPKVAQFNESLSTMGPRTQAVGRGLGTVTSALAGPWGLALGAGVTALAMFANAKAEAKSEVDRFTQAIEADSGALGENARETALAALEKDGLAQVATDLGFDLDTVVDAALGDARAMDEIARATREAVGAGVGMEGNLTRQADGADKLQGRLAELAERSREGEAASKRHAEVVGEEGEAAQGAATGVDALSAAQAGAVGTTDEMTASQKELQGALESWVDPLGTYTELVKASAQATADSTADSKDSWEDYKNQGIVSLDEFAAKLEEQNEAHRKWRDNLVTVAREVGPDVAQHLAEMGEEGVQLTAQMAEGTAAESKRAADAIRDNMALGGQQATQALDRELQVMAVVGAAGGKRTATSIARELQIGADQVLAIAKTYGVNLQKGIDPLLLSLGRTASGGQRVAGEGSQGGVTRRAQGGPVWGAGTATSDSIPALLSNGEYVIRADSVNRYGHDFLDAVNAGAYAAGGLVRRFAAGGFASTSDVPKPPSTKPFGPPISTAGDATMDYAYKAAVAAVERLAPQLMTVTGGASAKGLNPQFLAMFNAYNAAIGNVLKITSGWRSSAQQAVLYRRWINRVPGQAPAAPPGRSNHEKGLAIDHSPHSTARMRAIAGAHGLRYPMSYEPWHVEPARISRGHSGGGPVRMAAGGAARRPAAARPPALQQLLAGNGGNGVLMGTVSRAVWEALKAAGWRGNPNDNAERLYKPTARSAAELRAMLAAALAKGSGSDASRAAVTAARIAAAGGGRGPDKAGRPFGHPDYGSDRGYDRNGKPYAKPPTTRPTAPAAAPRTLTQITAGMTDPKKIREAVEAYEDYNRKLERNRGLLKDMGQANHDLAIARRTASADIAKAKAEMATELKLAKTKADRAEAYKKYDAAVKRGSEEITRALEKQKDAQQAIKDSQLDDARERERASVDKLIESLEREEQAREDAKRAADEQLDTVNRLLDQEKAARQRGLDAEADYAEKVMAIQRRQGEAATTLAQQQQRLMADRRQQLVEWAALDQRQVVGWGNTVGQLLANTRDQAAQFEEWMAALADARRRGVSEQVITSLGLDEGPAALGQLRQFGQATQAEIDALNAEVARRTALAQSQVNRERQVAASDLAQALAEAHSQYTEEMARLNEELVQAQAELLADQAEVANELAAIGRDQGRSYGQALTEGLRSQLPAVVAAAQALQAAAANAGMMKPGQAPNLPGGSTSPWRRRTYDAGGPLEPGYTLAYNGTGRTEFVVTAAQMAGSGGVHVHVNAPVFGVDQLHATIRGGVQAALTEQKTAASVAGVR